jgi:molybdate transport system permease protein
MTEFLTPEAWGAVFLSLKVSLIATLFSLPLAIFIGYVLARWRFRGWHLLNSLVHLPLILPPVVTGYLLLTLFGRRGLIGEWLFDTFGLIIAFRWTGAALAAAIMGFPLMVRAIRLAIEAIDPGLNEAAHTLGASKLRTFFTLTLPLATPGIIAGAILGFAKAMGEFGATITFVAAIPGETLTVPSAIYGLLQIPGQESSVIRLVILSILLAMGALIASEYLARRVQKRIGQR